MEGSKVIINRDIITEAAAMAFADPNLEIPDRYDRSGEVPAGVVVGGGDDESYELPVVDMARLLDPEHWEAEVAWLGSACRSWGFFQLINHGVDEAVIQKMKDNTVHFFELPLEDKNAVAVCPDGGIEGFGHHFRTSADKLDWAENLIVETQPIERRKLEFWPSNPPTFRSQGGKWPAWQSQRWKGRRTRRLVAAATAGGSAVFDEAAVVFVALRGAMVHVGGGRVAVAKAYRGRALRGKRRRAVCVPDLIWEIIRGPVVVEFGTSGSACGAIQTFSNPLIH